MDGILTLRWRSYILTTGLANTPVRAARAAVAITFDLGIVDDGLAAVNWNSHRLLPGDSITITGANNNLFNGTFHIPNDPTYIVDANQFVIRVPGALHTMANPTGASASIRCMAQKAILVAASGNAAALVVGGDSLADTLSIAAGATAPVIEAPHGAKFDLADLYVQSTSATQNLKVMFI